MLSTLHARLRVHRAPGIPHALFGRRSHAQLGRNAQRECGDLFAFPGCCAARRSRRDALLIRGPCSAPMGPGSAVHREKRCTASGTRLRFAPPILRAISRSRIARSLSLGAHLCDPLGQAALRAQRNLLKRFNLMLPVQSPLAKIFPFPSDPNHSISLAIPAHTQGAFRDRHERKVGMRWTRAALLTRALICGRRSRVVLTPRRWRQVLEKQAS